MTWNYRVCKETYSKGTQDEEEYYSIREVYYDDAGTITSVTENAVGVSGYDINEIKFSLEKMQLALNKDVIDVDSLWPNAGLV